MYEKNTFINACTEKTCRKCMQLHVQCTSKLNKKQDYIFKLF